MRVSVHPPRSQNRTGARARIVCKIGSSVPARRASIWLGVDGISGVAGGPALIMTRVRWWFPLQRMCPARRMPAPGRTHRRKENDVRLLKLCLPLVLFAAPAAVAEVEEIFSP